MQVQQSTLFVEPVRWFLPSKASVIRRMGDIDGQMTQQRKRNSQICYRYVGVVE